MTQPYMKPRLQTEDPLDGKAPKKHRSHKKGARQFAKIELRDDLRDDKTIRTRSSARAKR